MGNYVSCTLATPLMKSMKASRVILPGGEVKQFREIVKAAEVMLECPNFFLTNSKSLHIGRRFSPLSADEELEFGSVYIMFPMRRVNSVVTAADLAVLFMAANSAAKRLHGPGKNTTSRRISPESGEEDSEDEDKEVSSRLRLLDGIDEEFTVSEFKYRLIACRSRKPSLETIKEESVCSR